MQNLVFQLLGPVEVLLIAFLAEFADPREKVVDILGPVGVVGGGRSHASNQIRKRKGEKTFRGKNQMKQGLGKRNKRKAKKKKKRRRENTGHRNSGGSGRESVSKRERECER